MLENLKLLAAHLGKEQCMETMTNALQETPKFPPMFHALQCTKQSNCDQCMKLKVYNDCTMTSPPNDTTALTRPSDRFKHNIVPWRESICHHSVEDQLINNMVRMQVWEDQLITNMVLVRMQVWYLRKSSRHSDPLRNTWT